MSDLGAPGTLKNAGFDTFLTSKNSLLNLFKPETTTYQPTDGDRLFTLRAALNYDGKQRIDPKALLSGDIYQAITYVGGHLESANFESGEAGWRIDAEGNVEFNSGIFRGALEAGEIHIPNETDVSSFHVDLAGNMHIGSAASDFANAPFSVSNDGTISAILGLIGGWTIATNRLSAGTGVDTVGLDSTITGGDDIRFFAGNAAPGSAPFQVTEAGFLFAADADIEGTITAESGTIGGFTITATQLSGTDIIIRSTGEIELQGSALLKMVGDASTPGIIRFSQSIISPEVIDIGLIEGAPQQKLQIIPSTDGNTDDWFFNVGNSPSNRFLQMEFEAIDEIFFRANSLILQLESSSTFIEFNNSVPSFHASPSATVDLGRATARWRNLYLGGGATIAGDASTRTINKNWAPSTDNARLLGTPTNRWSDVNAVLKSFIEPHPIDSTKYIKYNSLEGGDASAYHRGTGEISGGVLVVSLPDHFKHVTTGNNIQTFTTPYVAAQGVYVSSVSNTQIVLAGGDGKVDYIVIGNRNDFDNYEPVKKYPVTVNTEYSDTISTIDSVDIT